MFTIHARLGQARAGTLQTAHGAIRTPNFMPIATRGSVKHLANSDLAAIGNDIVLSNTYHLLLRPGVDTLLKVGGLHKLMNWTKPIITDSGGFQVFSLSRLRKITDDGVTFQSHIDGASIHLTPEQSMAVQDAIGSDIRMCFDYFPGYPATRADVERSVELTTKWAERCRMHLSPNPFPDQERGDREEVLLFGIVQGGIYSDLRARSATELTKLNFAGYAIGGLAVGEPPDVMYEVLDHTVPLLPLDKPHYLMGVGQPEQILEAVKRGIDLFDCVLPTRNARHGQVYLHTQPTLVPADLSTVWYTRTQLKNEPYATDLQPLDPYCRCTTCTSGYSRAYIRHLIHVGEPLASRLITVHNLTFYIDLLAEIRQHVVDYDRS